MRLLIAIAVCLCSVKVLHGQTLEKITPQRILIDETAVIRSTGLPPNERIRLEAELTDRAGESWVSHADFIADEHGTVDLSKQSPAAGCYKGISAMGLIWSMRPASHNVNVYMSQEHLGPQTIRFHLLRKGESVATAQLEQLSIAAGVRRTDLRGALHGVLFEPEACWCWAARKG